MMKDEQPSVVKRSWVRKFGDAGRGVKVAVRSEVSFFVHFFVTVLVVVVALAMEVSRADSLLLVLCVSFVFAAEMFNTAIESLARAITDEQRPEIRDALDIASGAVLTSAFGAVVVGLTVLGWPLLQKLLAA